MTDAALSGALPAPISSRLQWGVALRALRKLLNDKNDTVQVFTIMRALNGKSTVNGYRKLLRTREGGRLAYERLELAGRLSDPAYVASFPEGSVGAAYRTFLGETGYSADGLVEISRQVTEPDAPHPYAWFGRRTRDVHDLWHVLTGYKADEGLGEACLVAFSYAQTRGLGWALIAVGAALRSGVFGQHARAIREGYRNGKRAAWLLGENYEALLREPIESARRRLNIPEPQLYHAVPLELRDTGLPG
jgi:ubiquinone biosynthesis protein COQ4